MMKSWHRSWSTSARWRKSPARSSATRRIPSGVCPLRRKSFHARHDGYHSEPGSDEEVVNVLAEKSGNPRWAWDCYRRFIQMYSDVVMEVGKKYFEELIDEMKEKKGVKQDVELTADDLKELAGQFKASTRRRSALTSRRIQGAAYGRYQGCIPFLG